MKKLVLKAAIAVALGAAAFSVSAVGSLADVQILDRSTGKHLPVYFSQGQYWVAGQPGAKYAIQIRNTRGTRVLAVTSVDGLNVLSGETADYGQSGYVFESGQRYGIDGWRKSDSQVAAFVFTASGDSYAERIGKPRDLGVIGVALFREQPPVAVYSPPVIAKRESSSDPQTPSASASPKTQSHSPSTEKLTAIESAAPPALTGKAAPTTAEPQTQADARSRKPTPMQQDPAASAQSAPLSSPKLGTAHGERETSIVSRTQFVRNSPQPDEIIRIRYDSHANLMALGVIPRPQPLPHTAPNAFPGASAGYVPDPPAIWR